MAEFEEKLNSILGDQNAMSQIMALAQSLSGAGSPPAAETPHPEPAAAPPADMSLGLNQVDPRLLQLGGRILKEYQRGEDKNTALLLALKPFLRQERYAKVDQATGQIGPSGQGGTGIHGADRRGGACITGISRATGAIPV